MKQVITDLDKLKNDSPNTNIKIVIATLMGAILTGDKDLEELAKLCYDFAKQRYES